MQVQSESVNLGLKGKYCEFLKSNASNTVTYWLLKQFGIKEIEKINYYCTQSLYVVR